MNESKEPLKTTPLTAVHESLGAKMVPFAGFSMPVSYGSILEEHEAVRENVGIFDVSHMGEILVTGSGAKEFVNQIITNNCSKLDPGAVQYTVLCREDGTVVDDLLVYIIGEEKVLLVVNAANTAKDFLHIQSLRTSGIRVEDASAQYALLAVQGPRSMEVLKSCPIFAPAAQNLEKLPYYYFFSLPHGGMDVIVSRTGYTGEVGFEIFVSPPSAPVVWDSIIEAGKPFGIIPVGLAARDTLRFEASFCLYGQEIDDTTTPFEAGLGWVVKLSKPAFVGKEALMEEKRTGSRKTLIGLELTERKIARLGFPVIAGDNIVGSVTSGSFSPTLKKSLCMAFVETGKKRETEKLFVEIRGKRIEALPTPLPFYKSRAK